MQDVDVVVIGSGAGGLSAALALANQGQKVLVLEQHYLPGGWCHSFNLGGYKFSPGVHYIGELHGGGRMRRIFEGLGIGGDLTFYELNPDGLDHIMVQDEQCDIPRGKQELCRRLVARFPKERKGIARYLDTMDAMSRELDTLLDMRSLSKKLLAPLRAPTVMRWGMSTAGTLIDSMVSDSLLRAFLRGQAGDYGLPASRASAPVHAGVVGHYFDGGYYPKGGGGALPKAFIRGLRRAGGEIWMRAAVSQIMMERGRAIGVRLADGQQIRAAHVISNADAGVTFNHLLSEQKLSFGLQRKVRKAAFSVSAISLFCALDCDLRALGLDSGNYWYYGSRDVDAIYELGLVANPAEFDEAPGFFLTATTLKDPSKRYKHGHHTIEVFVFSGYDAFASWERTGTGERPKDYDAQKAAMTRAILKAVNKLIPNVERHVVFSELGTPLTNVHYVNATRGNLYGTAKSTWQVGPFGFQVDSGIAGLALCGASTLGHGVAGASISGLAAASHILGCAQEDLLQTPGREITLLSSELGANPAASLYAATGLEQSSF